MNELKYKKDKRRKQYCSENNSLWFPDISTTRENSYIIIQRNLTMYMPMKY